MTALNNAAIYTLLPGTIALYTNSEFLAGFEARQKALASAVETLETHLVSASVDSLKTAVEAVQARTTQRAPFIGMTVITSSVMTTSIQSPGTAGRKPETALSTSTTRP